MKYWLMKSEPSAYSIDDLQRDGRTTWNGVRNFQARNYMRDGMKRPGAVLRLELGLLLPKAAQDL